jgi:hypothetical protein
MRDVRVATRDGVFLDDEGRWAFMGIVEEGYRAYRHIGHREIFATRDKSRIVSQPRCVVGYE